MKNIKRTDGATSISSLIYFIPFIPIIILLSIIINPSENVENVTVISATIQHYKDVISTMIQIQATIIAIIISVSLAIVQLPTITYSMRLFRSYSKNPLIFFIILWYLISVFLDFVLLLKFDPGLGKIETSSYYVLYVSYIFFIGSLVLLVLYFFNMTYVLSPESIIKKLSRDVPRSMRTYLKKYDVYNENKQQEKKEYWLENDPFQPIDDIICISINKFDNRTVITGFNEMKKCVTKEIEKYVHHPPIRNDDGSINIEATKIMESKFLNKERIVSETVFYYCDHMKRLGKLLILKDEEHLALQVSLDLREVGLNCVRKGFSVDCDIIPTLTSLGIAAAKKDLIDVTRSTIEDINLIARNIHYDEHFVCFNPPVSTEANSISNSLKDIAWKAIERVDDKVRVLYTTYDDFKDKTIGVMYADIGFEEATTSYVSNLGDLTRLVLATQDFFLIGVDDVWVCEIIKQIKNIAEISDKKILTEHS